MKRRLARFRGNESGVAAIEFAFLLPVLILLFFGVVELAMALTCRADVANVASTTADLVAQESTISGADMTNVFAAANAILYPNSIANATITVYSIVDKAQLPKASGTQSSGAVAWSCQKTGNATAVTGPVTPPAGSNGGDMIAATNLDNNGNPQYGGTGSVIVATITYQYTSPTTKVISTPITMTNTFYSKPRRVAQIAAPASCS